MQCVVHKMLCKSMQKIPIMQIFPQKSLFSSLLYHILLLSLHQNMAWKHTYRCKNCGYTAEIYEGRGHFRQKISAIYCSECKSVQNIVVGGIIADVAPSFSSEVGRLCPKCGNDNIRLWDMHTCPKCQSQMEKTDEKEFWT